MQAIDAANTNWEKPQAWNIGAKVDFLGITLAGGYKRQWDFRDGFGASTVTSLSGHRWEVGARYIFGPNAVSAVYGHGVQERLLANPNDEELDHMMVAYRRTLGPGVFWYMNFTWADFTGENSVSSTDDNSGYAVSTGIRLNF